MTTTITILNFSFAVAIFVTIVGLLAWAIATQSRDYDPIQAGTRPIPRTGSIDVIDAHVRRGYGAGAGLVSGSRRRTEMYEHSSRS